MRSFYFWRHASKFAEAPAIASELARLADGREVEEDASFSPMRALGLASLLLTVTAAGLFLGRELRQRYKFKRRTPYDFYAKAGDPVARTEYGMGV